MYQTVRTVFLNGVLPDKETQFMEQLPGFAKLGKEADVWELRRGLCGMRQSSRIWNRALNASLVGWVFSRSACEWCVYSRRSDNGDTSSVVVQVDDMLAVSSNETEASRFQSELKSAWQISRDRSKRTIMLSQTSLIDKIISTYGQSDAKPTSTPIVHGAQLLRPDTQIDIGKTEREHLAALPYRSLVGSLMYVASGTRPDIMFAVSKLSRFLDRYREAHWQAAV